MGLVSLKKTFESIFLHLILLQCSNEMLKMNTNAFIYGILTVNILFITWLYTSSNKLFTIYLLGISVAIGLGEISDWECE